MSDIESDYEEEETKQKSEKNGTKSKKDDAENEGEDEDTSVSGSETGGETDDSEAEDEEEDEFDEDADIDRIFGEETSKKKIASKKPDMKQANDTLLNSIFGNSDEQADDEDLVRVIENEPENLDAYDEEEYGFKYLQKFDNDTRKQIIDEFHREALQHSYEEIEAMCCVVRTPDGIIDALHRTPPFLTKYEKARILGERARQLGAGAKPFIELEPDVIDEYTIAVMEMKQGKLPFIIKRPLPNGGCEYWKLADLEIL